MVSIVKIGGAQLFGCALLLYSPALSGAPAKPSEPELAFPGAEGAGRFAAGGRGGRVLHVTNLDDAGPGSLRAAVEQNVPRIVRFDVAGTIRLKSDLVIRHPQITINGQDAPAGGVALADHSLIVNADDVVIRYIRSRLGSQSGEEGDAVSIVGGRRIILDHVSASWSVDETLSVSARYDRTPGIYDVTVQWSIISESLRRAGHSKGDHGYGSLIRGGRGSRFSFHHNLWAHHVQRMPRPGNYTPIAEDPDGPLIEFRSNIFYNWGGTASGYNADRDSAATYAFIDNCYIAGPDTQGLHIFREENPNALSWFEGNSLNGVIPVDQWELVKGLHNALARAPDVAPVTRDPATGGCARVLGEAGASHRRDAVDRRIVEDVRTRSGRIIDNEADVGGWPDLSQ
ncbi:pectate lyase family protein [Sphingopyxis sp.]|uniref:pectate lyase family protein n=1 Tax=Sphingopyxis sp. TaxID=1908224 RepID=UPI003D0DF7EC